MSAKRNWFISYSRLYYDDNGVEKTDFRNTVIASEGFPDSYEDIKRWQTMIEDNIYKENSLITSVVILNYRLIDEP